MASDLNDFPNRFASSSQVQPTYNVTAFCSLQLVRCLTLVTSHTNTSQSYENSSDEPIRHKMLCYLKFLNTARPYAQRQCGDVPDTYYATLDVNCRDRPQPTTVVCLTPTPTLLSTLSTTLGNSAAHHARTHSEMVIVCYDGSRSAHSAVLSNEHFGPGQTKHTQGRTANCCRLHSPTHSLYVALSLLCDEGGLCTQCERM